MWTYFKIKYLVRQPVPKVSSKLIDQLIYRDFGDQYLNVKEKLAFIDSNSVKGKNRLSAAVLKLSDGDIAAIDRYIKICNADYRDVISQAEYPRRSILGFGEVSSEKLKQIYIEDWEEYSYWLSRK